jgi:glycyl-tRNA synthetase
MKSSQDSLFFSMREFEQMEMQFFHPSWFRNGMVQILERDQTKMAQSSWEQTRAKLRFHDHANLAHYANAAVDIEFEFPFGFRELEGIHSRTDFDLSQHQLAYQAKSFSTLILN